jgi:hypothetical protein
MTEGIDGEISDWYHGGKALDVQTAYVKIGDQEQSKAIDPEAKGVTFNFSLKAGVTHLQTQLSNSEGLSLGAYYVYIQLYTTPFIPLC